jgi:hypothetical protein
VIPTGPGHVGWLLRHGGVVRETSRLLGFWLALLVNNNRTPSPLFLVSVASKGLSPTVSLLFATLAGKTISVAAKGLTRMLRWRESN